MAVCLSPTEFLNGGGMPLDSQDNLSDCQRERAGGERGSCGGGQGSQETERGEE